MIDLIQISLNEFQEIIVRINLWFIIIVIVIGIIIHFKRKSAVLGYCEVDGAELGIGTSKIKLKPNHDDIQIAYKLWVELSTRKVGLPIDFENDVLIEIYKSWYDFFGITRELVKSLPATKVRQCDSTKELVNIAIDVLNSCLREHLTLWQAKFRHWYENEANRAENSEIPPQVLQRKYEHYDDLVKSMKEVNLKLMKYREVLHDIIFNEN